MKYINKNNNNEPLTLKKYRETTPNAIFKGFGDSGQLLKKALLNEQGHICAYCMKRISLKRNSSLKKPRVEVEHYLSQDIRPDMDLIYENMLGVCNGNIFDNEHCDKSKKEILLKILNPLKADIEQQISFSEEGEILSKSKNQDVEEDLILLNLNNRDLKLARRDTIDIALEKMKEKYPIRQWTKHLIQKEIDIWSSKDEKGKFKQFCQIAIWFWQQQMKRNRYPAK